MAKKTKKPLKPCIGCGSCRRVRETKNFKITTFHGMKWVWGENQTLCNGRYLCDGLRHRTETRRGEK